MSEFRQDALRKHWVVIAEERAARPCLFSEQSSGGATSEQACPFCEGAEHETPPAVAVHPSPPSPWRVRVTTNKYPAVGGDASLRLNPIHVPPAIDDPAFNHGGLFSGHPGSGRHEVIIESPNHLTRASHLDDGLLTLVWRAYQRRLAAVAEETTFPFARVFQNCGPRAGASIEHLHSQLIALPMIPNDAALELQQQKAWLADNNACGPLDLIKAEQKEETRVLFEGQGLIAFCPYASRFPYEVWITPTQQSPSFVDASLATIDSAAHLVRKLVTCFDQALQSPDYNYLIQTAPFDRSADDYYHWRIELFPRLTTAAGFEISSGCYINPVRPEDAAHRLRSELESQLGC